MDTQENTGMPKFLLSSYGSQGPIYIGTCRTLHVLIPIDFLLRVLVNNLILSIHAAIRQERPGPKLNGSGNFL